VEERGDSQLLKSIGQPCVSSGYLCSFIGHDNVAVILHHTITTLAVGTLVTFRTVGSGVDIMLMLAVPCTCLA